MNDHIPPPSDDGTEDFPDQEWDEVMLRELRSVPEDMDELFARRAMRTAIESAVLPERSPDTDPAPDTAARRRLPRTLVGLGVAAALLCVVLVSVVSMGSERRGSSVATVGKASDSVGSAAEMSDSAADSAVGGVTPDAAARSTTSATRPHTDYLGSFAEFEDLVDGLDDGSQTDTSTVPGEGSAGATGTTPSDDSPSGDVDECVAELTVRGHEVVGWAVVGGRIVIVVGGTSAATVQLFDAMTCTA